MCRCREVSEAGGASDALSPITCERSVRDSNNQFATQTMLMPVTAIVRFFEQGFTGRGICVVLKDDPKRQFLISQRARSERRP